MDRRKFRVSLSTVAIFIHGQMNNHTLFGDINVSDSPDEKSSHE